MVCAAGAESFAQTANHLRGSKIFDLSETMAVRRGAALTF
jgi:hypothetical protein